jgi:hypothetical protein
MMQPKTCSHGERAIISRRFVARCFPSWINEWRHPNQHMKQLVQPVVLTHESHQQGLPPS